MTGNPRGAQAPAPALEPPPLSPRAVPPKSKTAPGPRLWPWAIAVLLLVAAVGWWQFRPAARGSARPGALPFRTAKVYTGTLQQTLRVTGVTSANRYVILLSPQMQGSRRGTTRGHGDFELTLQKLAEGGIYVKKDDVVARVRPAAYDEPAGRLPRRRPPARQLSQAAQGAAGRNPHQSRPVGPGGQSAHGKGRARSEENPRGFSQPGGTVAAEPGGVHLPLPSTGGRDQVRADLRKRGHQAHGTGPADHPDGTGAGRAQRGQDARAFAHRRPDGQDDHAPQPRQRPDLRRAIRWAAASRSCASWIPGP